MVCGKHAAQHVPAFKTENYFGIGSGDIFSAVFAALWMEEQCSPFEAAETASAATAYYCNKTGILPLPPALEDLAHEFEPIDLDRIKSDGTPKTYGVKPIYLAGPFFTLSQKWLINQAIEGLSSVGLTVWSPSSEAGILDDRATETDVKRVVAADLAGLEKCGSLFACVEQMDPGTVFEIGYATKAKLPVTVYAENIRPSDRTMLDGTDCFVSKDFATAIAHATQVAYKL